MYPSFLDHTNSQDPFCHIVNMTVNKILEKCLVSPDPDLTGPGVSSQRPMPTYSQTNIYIKVRLSVIIPILLVLTLSLVWTIARGLHYPKVMKLLSKAISHLNALQMVTALV